MGRNSKKLLAWMLALAMLFTNVDYVGATAAGINEVVLADVSGGSASGSNVSVGDVPTNDGGDISAGDVSGNDVTKGDISAGDVTGGDVSGNDVSKGDISAGNVTGGDVTTGDTKSIMFSGKFHYGLTWTIFSDGILYISGEVYASEPDRQEIYPWHKYKEYFTKVVVDAKNVGTIGYWFDGCDNLVEVDLSQFDPTKIYYMKAMFRNCSSLKNIKFPDAKFGSGLDLSETFMGCSSLTVLDVTCLDTSITKNMTSMFSGCVNLKEINLSGLVTRNVVRMDNMFAGCGKLVELDLSSFSGERLYSTKGMLDGCYSLMIFKTPTNARIVLPHAMLDGGGIEYTTTPYVKRNIVMYKPLYSGEINDLKWLITNDEKLLIGGDGSGIEATNDTVLPWHEYKDYFNKVVVNATNISSTAYWFDGCDNICEADLNGLTPTLNIDVRCMFRGCSQLVNLQMPAYNKLVASNFSSMFEGCSKLTAINHDRIGTNNAVDLSNMFKGCSSLVDLDVSGFYTGSVKNMDCMFAGCSRLVELDVSGFNTSSLVSANEIFSGCNGLSRVRVFKNLNLHIELPCTMYDLEGNEYVDFPCNIEDERWLYANVSQSGDINGLSWMITDAGVLYISGSVNSVDNSQLQVYPWHAYKDDYTRVIVDAVNVKRTAYWFDGCSNITNIDLKDFRTATVTDMCCMFRGCSGISELDVTEFYTSKVTDFSGMFEGCSNLELLQLSYFNTKNAVDLSNMFKGCENLTRIGGVESFDVSNVTNMSSMFDGCRNLKYVYLGGMKTSNVTDMSYMFRECCSISSNIGLSQIDTSNVTDMSYILYGCSSIKNLYLQKMEFANGVNTEGFLYGCTGIEKIKIPINLNVDIELPKEMFDFAGTSYTEYLPKGLATSILLYSQNPGGNGGLRMTPIASQTYTGKAIKPDFKVYDGTKELVKNVDYTVAYKNNVNSNEFRSNGKTPMVVIKGKGQYSGQRTATFDILTKNIADEDVVVNEIVIKADGKIHLPTPTITYNGKKLVKNKDFKVRYFELEEDATWYDYRMPGVHRIGIEGINNFEGSYREVCFTITDGPMMKNVKIKSISKQVYTGNAIEPTMQITYKGKELVEDRDYKVLYENNIEIGKATAIITGMDQYTGTRKVTFQIVGQSISKASVSGIENKIYNGGSQIQNIKVELAGELLLPGTDYIVEYTNNVNVGKAGIKITGKGIYSGIIKKSFKITAYDLAADNQEMVEGVPYGLEVAYEKGGSTPEVKLFFDGTPLNKKDYTVTYSNNNKIASARDKAAPTIIIKGKGNFKGIVKVFFTIHAKNLQDTENPIFVQLSDVVYSKKSNYICKPVLFDSNGKRLVAGIDYDKNIVYTLEDGTKLDKNSKVDIGSSVKISITGKGKYTGMIQTSYRVTAMPFKKAKITIDTQMYTGRAINLTPGDISVKFDNEFLVYGVDYEIVEGSYVNNVKCGTASVMVRGLGEYGGNQTIQFKIRTINFFEDWAYIAFL